MEWALSILEDKLESDIHEMQPTERVKLWATLQEYIRPKLARQTLTHEGEIQVKQTTVEFVGNVGDLRTEE